MFTIGNNIMAWLNKLNLSFEGKRSFILSGALLAALVASGCNVGKTDTVTTTSGATTTTSTTKSGCMGSYIGNYGPPDHDERIRLRNLSLANRGIAVTGNDDIDNANAGGGSPDGGIWMGGSYRFETDGNCNVIAGTTMIFYAYEYGIGGTVNKDGSFNLIWSGQGSQGDMKGKVDANNNISGQFFHPAPDSFVYGVISGTFTPNGKI
jgi:hypothetical protein